MAIKSNSVLVRTWRVFAKTVTYEEEAKLLCLLVFIEQLPETHLLEYLDMAPFSMRKSGYSSELIRAQDKELTVFEEKGDQL